MSAALPPARLLFALGVFPLGVPVLLTALLAVLARGCCLFKSPSDNGCMTVEGSLWLPFLLLLRLLEVGSRSIVVLCRLPDAVITRELPPRDDDGLFDDVPARGVFPRLGVPVLLTGRERTEESFCPRDWGPSIVWVRG